jgi:hypothetical protein
MNGGDDETRTRDLCRDRLDPNRTQVLVHLSGKRVTQYRSLASLLHFLQRRFRIASG